MRTRNRLATLFGLALALAALLAPAWAQPVQPPPEQNLPIQDDFSARGSGSGWAAGDDWDGAVASGVLSTPILPANMAFREFASPINITAVDKLYISFDFSRAADRRAGLTFFNGEGLEEMLVGQPYSQPHYGFDIVSAGNWGGGPALDMSIHRVTVELDFNGGSGGNHFIRLFVDHIDFSSPDAVAEVPSTIFGDTLARVRVNAIDTLDNLVITDNPADIQPPLAPYCQPGSFASTGREPCQQCPVGTSAAVAGATSCEPCAAGTYAESGSATCEPCAGGTSAGQPGSAFCEPCAAGTYAESGSATCEPCAAGSFAAQPGSAACEPCPPNTFSVTAGAAACEPCPAGAIATAERTGCVSPEPTILYFKLASTWGDGYYADFTGVVEGVDADGDGALGWRHEQPWGPEHAVQEITRFEISGRWFGPASAGDSKVALDVDLTKVLPGTTFSVPAAAGEYFLSTATQNPSPLLYLGSFFWEEEAYNWQDPLWIQDPSKYYQRRFSTNNSAILYELYYSSKPPQTQPSGSPYWTVALASATVPWIFSNEPLAPEGRWEPAKDYFDKANGRYPAYGWAEYDNWDGAVADGVATVSGTTVYRSPKAPFYTTGTDKLYVSFLLSQSGGSWGGVSFFNGEDRALLIGRLSGQAQYGVEVTGLGIYTGGPAVDDRPHRITAEFDFGADLLRLFVDHTDFASPDATAPLASALPEILTGVGIGSDGTVVVDNLDITNSEAEVPPVDQAAMCAAFVESWLSERGTELGDFVGHESGCATWEGTSYEELCLEVFHNVAMGCYQATGLQAAQPQHCGWIRNAPEQSMELEACVDHCQQQGNWWATAVNGQCYCGDAELLANLLAAPEASCDSDPQNYVRMYLTGN